MVGRRFGWAMLWAVATAAGAADGISAPPAAELWPQWQARISLQTAAVSPLSLAAPWLHDASTDAHAVQGAAVIGDYTFARSSFGAFRASGGLVVGRHGGAPRLSSANGAEVGVSLRNTVGAWDARDDAAVASPYVGIGFSGGPWHDTVVLSADLGLVADRDRTRALFGTQGVERALRELRVAPLVQLGVHVRF